MARPTYFGRAGAPLIVPILASALALPSIAKTDPSPNVRWAMSEPVTLFDLGLLRLEGWLETEFESMYLLSTESLHEPSCNVEYDWSMNRIVIKFTVGNQIVDDVIKWIPQSEAAAVGKGTVERIRIKLGVSADGKATPGQTMVSSFFQHQGFTSKNRPPELDQELNSIIVIQVVVQTFDPVGSQVTSADLIGGRVMASPWSSNVFGN